jgi:DNA helicase-2/ATP-dependent DNA helicase PcrA
MVCDADVERKGMGAIRTRDAESHESAADQVAQEIKDSIDAGDSPKDFGILVRNNAEHDAYTLALLVRGIPYRLLKRGEGGYFGKPLVRSLTAWMRLVVRGSNEEINQAVLDAHMTPGFGLDQKFASNLSRVARGNYLDHILAGKSVYDGKAAWLNKRVGEYADVIRSITAAGGMDSPSLIRAILGIKGAKGTFEQALMKLVDEDDIIEEDGAEAGEEAIRNAAMAPLRPLMLMAENFQDPANLLSFVAKMKAANEKAQKNSPDDKEDWKEPAVLVGTVHGWKGLQAKHCFVCMAGGVFPNAKTEEKAQEEGDANAFDEDRRLAYVAITRGEETVTVMSPQKNYLGKEAGTSRFIYEACIPVVGEKEQADIPTDQAEENLVDIDPKQEKLSGFSPKASTKASSDTFSQSLIRYAFSVQSCDDCDGSCENSEGSGKCDGNCTCSDEAQGFSGENGSCPCKKV